MQIHKVEIKLKENLTTGRIKWNRDAATCTKSSEQALAMGGNNKIITTTERQSGQMDGF